MSLRIMPNDWTGLNIRVTESNEGTNPPQNLDLNIIDAVWEHLDREWNKRQPTSKEELWMSFNKPAELFMKTPEHQQSSAASGGSGPQKRGFISRWFGSSPAADATASAPGESLILITLKDATQSAHMLTRCLHSW